MSKSNETVRGKLLELYDAKKFQELIEQAKTYESDNLFF